MKYKLIKIYPGSPELGTVVEKGYIGYVPEGHSKNLGSWSLSNALVENYPEFWQPESEWVEISKLTNSPKGSLHWLNTMMGRHLRIGETLTHRIEDFDNLYRWGIGLQESSEEIMEYFKDKLK